MSHQSNVKAGCTDVAPRKRVDFAAAKLVSAATVAELLQIEITGSDGNFLCQEHNIRGSDRAGYMLWWQGTGRVGDNTNLVQLLRPGIRAAAAVELLLGESPKSLAALAPEPPVVLTDTPAHAWREGEIAQALLDADEMSTQLVHMDAIFEAELAFDLFDEHEQSAVTEAAIEAQQSADEFEAQEHAYASFSAELVAI